MCNSQVCLAMNVDCVVGDECFIAVIIDWQDNRTQMES